jgi:hypothetical protein
VADGILVRIPLAVMATIVAGLALGVEVLGLAAGYGPWSLALLAIPAALAVAFLLEYRKLPYEPWRPPRASVAPPTPAEPEEEFVDPVEEADQLEHPSAPPEGTAPAPPESGAP